MAVLSLCPFGHAESTMNIYSIDRFSKTSHAKDIEGKYLKNVWGFEQAMMHRWWRCEGCSVKDRIQLNRPLALECTHHHCSTK